jgi:hypothetical protein
MISRVKVSLFYFLLDIPHFPDNISIMPDVGLKEITEMTAQKTNLGELTDDDSCARFNRSDLQPEMVMEICESDNFLQEDRNGMVFDGGDYYADIETFRSYERVWKDLTSVAHVWCPSYRILYRLYQDKCSRQAFLLVCGRDSQIGSISAVDPALVPEYIDKMIADGGEGEIPV